MIVEDNNGKWKRNFWAGLGAAGQTMINSIFVRKWLKMRAPPVSCRRFWLQERQAALLLLKKVCF
jgi:hypothetical protein